MFDLRAKPLAAPEVLNELHKRMRPRDVHWFRVAANTHNVHILVRRTNEGSLQYIEIRGYTPKPIDCKAKTADNDVVIKERFVRSAGLVVDPHVVGPEAFRGGKYQPALEKWVAFMRSAKRMETGDGSEIIKQPGRPGFYRVDMDESSKHYGCLMLCSHRPDRSSYLHSDYDLFAVIDVAKADGRSDRPRVKKNNGVEDKCNEPFLRVENFLNRMMGSRMIQHGPQECLERTEEGVDVFWAGGNFITLIEGARVREVLHSGPNARSDITRLYVDLLKRIDLSRAK